MRNTRKAAALAAHVQKRSDKQSVEFLVVIGALFAAAFAFAFFMAPHAHAATNVQLPTTDQFDKAFRDTATAWQDWVVIWGLVYPIIVQIPAMFKDVQKIPGIGNVLKYVAGNWGFAKNVAQP